MLLVWLLGFLQKATAGPSLDSTRRYYDALNTGQINDSSFLEKCGHFILPVMYDSGSDADSLLSWYEKVSFNRAELSPYQSQYYFLAINRCFATGNIARGMYLARKLKLQAVQSHNVYQFFNASYLEMTLYVSEDLTERAIETYTEVLPACRWVYRNAAYFEENSFTLSIIATMMGVAAEAYADAGQCNQVMACIRDLQEVETAMQQKPEKYEGFEHSTAFFIARSMAFYHKCQGNIAAQEHALERARDIVLAADFPASQKIPCLVDIYNEQYRFLQENGRNEAAARLLDTISNQPYPVIPEKSKIGISKKSAGLYYARGEIIPAYQQLLSAYIQLDSLSSNIIEAQRENLLAQVESVMARENLEKAQEAKRKSDWMVVVLLFSIAVLLLLGGSLLLMIRNRNQRRQYETKLELARNLHDDLGPLLLYTRLQLSGIIAARKEGTAELHEVEHSLLTAGERLRDLSHELKHEGKANLSRLMDQTRRTMEKVLATKGITLTIRDQIGTLWINEGLCNDLQLALNELMANSVRHAQCTAITLETSLEKQKIQWVYSDNGNGFAPRSGQAGMGLENIEARIKRHKGSFVLKNDYPEGYRIVMSVPVG